MHGTSSLAYRPFTACVRTHPPNQAVRKRPAGVEVAIGMSQIGGREQLRARVAAARGVVRMDAIGGISASAVVDVRLPERAGGVQRLERREAQGADGEVATTQMVIHVPLLDGVRQLTRDVEEPLAKSLGRLRVTFNKAANKGPKQRKKKVVTSDPADSAAVAPPLPLRCLPFLCLPAPFLVLAARLRGSVRRQGCAGRANAHTPRIRARSHRKTT